MGRVGTLKPSRARTVIASLVFYGGLAVLLAAIFTKTLAEVLPRSLATPIGYDSEGFFFAIVLAAWIQFGRWRLEGAQLWRPALTLGAFFALAGVWLLSTDPPSSIKTLNETCFALAVLVPYVALRRPLPGWAPVLSLVLIAAVVTGVVLWPDSLVVNLAETMTTLVLAPLAFDLFDQGILDREPWTDLRLRLAGYAALIVIPTVVVLLGTERRTEGGLVNNVLHYLGRSQESFVGILLVALFLAVGLGASGRPRGETPATFGEAPGRHSHRWTQPRRRRSVAADLPFNDELQAEQHAHQRDDPGRG